MNLTSVKCPVCGADIQIDPDRIGENNYCFCMYCGSSIQVHSAVKNIFVDGVASANAIFTRGYQFLQMSDFEKAKDYFSKILDLEPTNARAFLGQLLAICKCTNTSDLKVDIRDYYQYQFAFQYGDDALREELVALSNKARNHFLKDINDAKLQSDYRTLSANCIYNFLWGKDEKLDDSRVFCRFDSINLPAVICCDNECTSIRDVLPALEVAVGYKDEIVMFVHHADDELLETLRLNRARDVFHCIVVCLNDFNEINKIASFCGTVCNSTTIEHVQKAYINGKNIILIN